MIERIIENWLDKASEKGFQIPFCYMLINQGHTIIHMTRHCGMEHGKDIISRDKAGNICAYQLKGAPGSKIKLRDWQKEIQGQVYQLVFTPVTHPSVESGNSHKSYLVTNGGIEEEVFNAIYAFNNQYEKQSFKINTIVDGELKDMAKKLGFAFLPADILNFKTLLEFLLDSGKGSLDKDKLASLLESVLTNDDISLAKKKERINSAALLISIATSNHINECNYFAIYESWIMYISYLFWYTSKQYIPEREWQSEYKIAEQLAINALKDLWDELKEKQHFLTGNYLQDVFFYRAKKLLLLGLMSELGLYYLFKKNDFNHSELKIFLVKNLDEIEVWGESATPYLLSIYWYYKKVDATNNPALFLQKHLQGFIIINKNSRGLANPYYGLETCLSDDYQQEKIIQYDKYNSYYIEGLTNLYVLQNYKQEMKFLWPDLTHFVYKEFRLESKDDFFKWRNEVGKEFSYMPKFRKEWLELRTESLEHSGEQLPDQIKDKVFLYPLILAVFPHRSSSSGIRWFNHQLSLI